MSGLTRIVGPALLAGLCLSAPAQSTGGPVPSTGPQPAKVEEIEKAGEALARGQAEEAFRLLLEAVKKNPALPPARLMYARMLVSMNQAAPGRANLELAAAEEPEHPEIYLTFAKLSLSEGRISDAVLNCTKALELSQSPRWTADQKKNYQREARQALANAYEARKDWPAARAQLFAWLELEPRNGLVRQRLARALFYMNKPDEALTELAAAVKDDPALDPPAVSMGRLWASKQEFKKAQEQFDAAVKKESGNYKVHLAYADFLLSKGDVDAAKIHAEAAAKIDPKAREVRSVLGLVARHTRDYKEAMRLFQDILNETPADQFASNQLALVLADQSDESARRKALQFAEMNARQYPRSAEAMATLGYVCYRTGNLDNAQKALQASISGGQASSDTAYYLALLLNDRKEYEEAKRLLKGALDSPGGFVFRKDAQALYDKLVKQTAEAPKPGDAKDKAKAKS